MTPEVAKLAMSFLSRATLHGSEVPAFNAVMGGLQCIANGLVVCKNRAEEPLPGETPDKINTVDLRPDMTDDEIRALAHGQPGQAQIVKDAEQESTTEA